MILICSKCNSRLQVDETKIPARTFEVRCPNCQSNVSVPAPDITATARIESTPDAVESGFERPVAAKLFNPREDRSEAAPNPTGNSFDEIAKLLAAVLQQSGNRSETGGKRPAWQWRKALVCASPAYRETIAELLSKESYDVFVAENTAQGLVRMREERMDVVIIDADFDPLEQGVAFVTREVRQMRPPERRRLFFVYVSSAVRTMDVHAAFLNNVNLVVNPSDIEQLPEVLDLSIRHYNDLYKPFTQALNIPPI